MDYIISPIIVNSIDLVFHFKGSFALILAAKSLHLHVVFGFKYIYIYIMVIVFKCQFEHVSCAYTFLVYLLELLLFSTFEEFAQLLFVTKEQRICLQLCSVKLCNFLFPGHSSRLSKIESKHFGVTLVRFK